MKWTEFSTEIRGTQYLLRPIYVDSHGSQDFRGWSVLMNGPNCDSVASIPHRPRWLGFPSVMYCLLMFHNSIYGFGRFQPTP
jgi:hypothetical protein